MSISEENKKNTIEATEESVTETPEFETMTLEDLEADVTDSPMNFTATLHFEFSDIFNAIEHIEQEPEPEPEVEKEAAEESVAEGEMEADPEPESEEVHEVEEPEATHESAPETEPETEPEELARDEEPEAETPEHADEQTANSEEPAVEEAAQEEPVLEESDHEEPVLEEEAAQEEQIEEEPVSEELASEELTPEETAPAPKSSIIARLKGQDPGTKKLMLTDVILLAVVLVSIIVGLVIANSFVDKANAAKAEKIAAAQESVKQVKLAESLRVYAADEVLEDIKVPTYSLDELYALDLREKTGFTAEDLKIVTTRGLVGCEEAFVKAEETYGVNSIFLISIASLESAYGTQMFRPNNMFGYGRTGFSSKEECIMTVAKGLGTRYLPPGGSLYGGSPTLKGVNKRYAANPQWYYKVGKYMQRYYNELAAAKNGNLEKFE